MASEAESESEFRFKPLFSLLQPGELSRQYFKPGRYTALRLLLQRHDQHLHELYPPGEVLLEVNVSWVVSEPDKTYTTTRIRGNFSVDVIYATREIVPGPGRLDA
ncbi:hypothetical protein BC827DRAFT_1157626 [Russula dissimulans]|nr:hypothetical protein BC827DRAFT_1157626 [Russula dissimulans]